MKATATFRRYHGVLSPVGEDARDVLASIKDGADVLIDVRTARSVRQLRLFWALMGLLADNIETFANKDDAADQIKLDCGAVDWFIHHRTGVRFGRPRSIAFESMTQDRFNAFMERVFWVVEAHYAPGQSEAFKREMYAMVDGPDAIGERAA